MAIRYWKRMREKAVEDTAESFAAASNPWEDAGSEIIDLEPGRTEMSADERAAQYNDWAERMKAKRQRNREAILGSNRPEPSTGYWTPDSLFADSKLADEDDLLTRPNPWRVEELLSVLDLTGDAEPEDVSDAYRRLAKQHHPDRFIAADADTQQFHADRMTDIIKAYRALKQLQRA